MGKILFLSSFVPCDKTAGLNYTRFLLNDLVKVHTIDLICFDGFNHQLDTNLQNSCRSVKIYKVTNLSRILGWFLMPLFQPFFLTRFNWKIATMIKKLVEREKYDWVYLDFSQMFVYGLFINNVPKILMSHDVISQFYKRRNSHLNYKWASWSEKKMLGQKNGSIFTFSEKDKGLILEQYGYSSQVTSFYISSQITHLSYPIPRKDVFLFYGAWNRIENTESLSYFLDEVLPLLGDKFSFKILGGGMSDSLKRKIEGYSNISYLGFVDNPYTFLAESKALIAPLKKGAGVKVKVIEAIACGCPVIGSDVAFEGISEDFKEMMLLADTAESYKRWIECLDVPIEKRTYYRNMMINKCENKTIVDFLSSK